MITKTLSAIAGLAFLFSSCTSPHYSEKQVIESAIPTDFKKCRQCILLLPKRTSGLNARGMNNYLQKSFTKYYSGKFELAAIEDIENSVKYKDKSIYRFVLEDATITHGYQTRTTTGNNISSSTTIQYNNAYRLYYRLFDRLENKEYLPLGVSSNVPARSMNKTASLLNKKYNE